MTSGPMLLLFKTNMKENARARITSLIQKYEDIKRRGLIRKYDESNTKKDFILPLFEILGWNIRNREEVTSEAHISRGRVDYAFKISGIPKFLLEVKALKIDLDKREWAEQVINYAWHKGVVWAVLSNFEAIKVFNAEWLTKSPEESQLFEIKYNEYLDKFAQLSLLSKESFLENRLDREAEKWGRKRRKAKVDEELLRNMMEWRKKLALSIRKNRQRYSLSEEEIDEAIQRILDRLIFIRTCEDRGIEPSILQPLIREYQERPSSGLLIRRLKKTFRDFDSGYNSQLFAPHLCEDLVIDDKVLIQIIEELYETKDRAIRYDFSAIDADVLGSMYEQYLGHILKETPKRATLKERPKRRKEMGIYYTPKYIVDYIVKNTVGALLKKKPYREAVGIKILDPACGSGSFLIRAFEEMDNYLKEKRTQRGAEFDYFRRMEILNRNLYGVDLDRQAVEIAQLNLLLKALEKRQPLPKLRNIRQGNSLISGTEEELKKYFGKDYQSKHPFNWEEEFPEVFKKEGFDVVIGNPPYVSFGLRGVERVESDMSNYLRNKYPNSAEYKLSTYAIFIDRGIQKLRPGGYLSFIVPDSFLLGRYFSKLRRYILDTCKIKEIILFQEDFWKAGVVGFPIILILQKEPRKIGREKNKLTAKLCPSLEDFSINNLKSYSYEQKYFEKILYNRFRLFFDKKSKAIVDKMNINAVELREIVSIASGLIGKRGKAEIISRKKKGANWLPGLLSGSEINRYLTTHEGNFILFDIRKLKSGFKEANYSQPKLFLRQTGDKLIGTYDDKELLCLNNLHVVNLINKQYDLQYVLAILNSKLMNYYYQLITLEKGRTMAQTDIETLEQLPIHKIDFSNPKEKQMHDELVKLVDKMLDLNKKLQKATPHTDHWYALKSEIEKTDRTIDQRVYKLYGLTQAEIKIMEGA